MGAYCRRMATSSLAGSSIKIAQSSAQLPFALVNNREFSDFHEIEELMRKVHEIKYRVELIHTNMSGDVDKEWLSRIELLKSKFNVSVGYGSHCINKKAIYTSLAFRPDSLLFYVKMDENIIYPDNVHAYSMKEVPVLVGNINDLTKAIGPITL